MLCSLLSRAPDGVGPLKYLRFLLFTVLFIMLSGCATKPEALVTPSPVHQIYSTYENKIPGKYALHVDAAAFQGDFFDDSAEHVLNYQRKWHYIAMDARPAFQSSTLKTFQIVFDTVSLVPEPLGEDELREEEWSGQIIVMVNNVETDMVSTHRDCFGLYYCTIDRIVHVTTKATATIRKPNREELSFSATAKETHLETAGFENDLYAAARALGKATSDAIEEVLRLLVEQVSNSPELRGV